MSREKDINALKQLKNDMVEADAFADIAGKEWEKSRQIKAEIDNTRFEFKPLPTNNYETAKMNFVTAWKNLFADTAKFRMIFLGLYSLAMLVVSVFLLIDFFGQKDSVFHNTAFLFADNGSVEMLLITASMVVFFLAATFLPWLIVKKKLPDFIEGIMIYMLGGFVIGGLLFWYTAANADAMFVLFGYIIAPISAVILGFLIHIVFLIISKIPVFSAKQKAILETEKKKDIDNTESNKVNEPKEKEEWEKWWEVRKAELKELGLHHLSLGDDAMEKAKQHLAAANESTVLGENEKNIEVIDILINFIESHRADSIKEALHEYDAMRQNQKVLEIEAIKAQIEIEKSKKENADRRFQMEQQRRHQLEMEAQARRNADLQSQIAANTAAAAASTERLRKQAASAAADIADAQARIENTNAAIYRNEYYNS